MLARVFDGLISQQHIESDIPATVQAAVLWFWYPGTETIKLFVKSRRHHLRLGS